jgi:hypothetical protein
LTCFYLFLPARFIRLQAADETQFLAAWGLRPGCSGCGGEDVAGVAANARWILGRALLASSPACGASECVLTGSVCIVHSANLV